ncbi:hypothetical protein PC116_g18411 [Phytophthora cactorum]|uniref:Uncharacterized protein n=1 Tax=Phytophthora cactorum TaxID=29920 RepID=A0A8T1FL07_9STRA|nr:hypothetical protein Pcac1_g5212 [Phytophthora cactorum]KAG2816286.1 hypothetical protein PC111_g13212 [Phytophthora cactorum]KAG2974552.1 hypothetical protein PC118_g14449 [Phytophthora cactorum]KAG3005599.1 hypothetical protein PC119_g15247 [Phytophthora cactorum]KAG3011564.1 hypothetical protein PC120_g14350 [Phytophthora cactorum]
MSSGDLRRKRRRMTKWTWWWRHSTQDDERGESNRAVKLVQNLNDNSSFATVRVTIVGEVSAQSFGWCSTSEVRPK